MIREAFTTPDLPVWLFRLVFSVTLVCLAAALASLVLRRFSAAVRHRVWALSVAASLAMPAMIAWSPEIRLGWLNVSAPRPTLAPDSPLVADLQPAPPAIEFDPRVFDEQAADRNVPPRKSTPAPKSEPAAHVQPPRNPLEAAVETRRAATAPRARIIAAAATQTPRVSAVNPNTFWLLVLIVPAACGIWQSVRAARAVRRVVDDARLVEDPAVQELVADVCRRLGWQRVLELRESRRTPIPLCVGWKKPCILLPRDWQSWGDMTLRAVVAHEVSHIVRRDVAWQTAARVACFMYWFHPLVWMAARKMRVERETACDDSVLAIVERPVDYASVLLRFAREMVAHRAPAAALPMSSFSGLEGRVRAILDKSRPRTPVGPRVGRLCALAAILIAAGAASLSPLSREISGVAEAGIGNSQKPDWHWPESDKQPDGQGHPLSIAGRVVLKTDRNQSVARAKILGIPENPKASYVTAVTDEKGGFRIPGIRSAMLLLAQRGDGQFLGIARGEPQDTNVVIPIGRSVSAHGRIMDSKGNPLPSWPLEYCLVLDGSYLDEFHISQTQDAKRLLGGMTSADQHGNFRLPGLAPGWTYRITCCPGTVVNGAIQPFVTLTTFTSAQTGVTELGEVKRPPISTMDDSFLNASSSAEQVEKGAQESTESARLLDQRLLVVAGSHKNEIVRGIRAIMAMSSPVNWSPDPSKTPVDPLWAKEKENENLPPLLQQPLFNFSVLGMEVGPGSPTSAFLERHKVKSPAGDDVALAALDIDGHIIAQTSGRELFGKNEPSAKPLARWLHKHSAKLPDAEKLLAQALAQARRENKRVFLRENAPSAGAYCARLGHYVEQFKDLIEKDYVCLRIDVRSPHAIDVINRIRDFDVREFTSGSGYSLPWMVILDAAGRPLASGTSPHGNIGIPVSAQETSYFSWMLRATSQRLTEEEIATLVSALNQENH
jgi:beta-lactamase regulating signal transducer with metallopeptidase domain